MHTMRVNSIKLLVLGLGFHKTTPFFVTDTYHKFGFRFQTKQIADWLTFEPFYDRVGPPVRPRGQGDRRNAVNGRQTLGLVESLSSVYLSLSLNLSLALSLSISLSQWLTPSSLPRSL